MSTNQSSSEPLPGSEKAAPDVFTSAPIETVKIERYSPSAGRAGQALLWLAVLMLAAALIWMWQDGKKRDSAWQTNLAQRQGALEEAQSERSARERQYENRLQVAQEKIAALELRVHEWQTSRQALEKRYRQLLPLRDDVTVREVEYRVHFAAQQLAMGGNVSAALAALQDADAELTTLNRADLATVKTTLTQTIEALQRTPMFDMRGFLARFDQALEMVDRMAPQEIPTTMPPAKTVVDATASWWRRGWAETKEIVLSMVRLQVSDTTDESVGEAGASRVRVTDTALDQKELRLRLLSLRLMVLSRQPMVGAEAKAVQIWLARHFAESDPAVQTLQSLLEELVSSPVSAPLPEVSPVLDALRLWRAAQTTSGSDADGL